MLNSKKILCTLLTALLLTQGAALAAPVLRLNSHGRDVLKLQQMLNKAGYAVNTSGIYDQDLQAEPVYYCPEEVECKAKWDVNRTWSLTATPRYRQKPLSITKQKPDKQKQLKNRNLERAKKLGKEYIKGERAL